MKMEPEAEIKEKMSQTEPQSYNLLKHTMQLSLALGGIMLSACAGHDEVIVDLPGEAVAVSFHAGKVYSRPLLPVLGSPMDIKAKQKKTCCRFRFCWWITKPYKIIRSR